MTDTYAGDSWSKKLVRDEYWREVGWALTANGPVKDGYEGLSSALHINVPPATIAAWRAHSTRGTYSTSGSQEGSEE